MIQGNEPPVILVVEDDALIRMAAVDLFEDEGFAVIEADGADAALVLLGSRSDIALMFTDIQMPGTLDGLALAHRTFANWPNVLLIITSGQVKPLAADLPDRARFIRKPYQGCDVVGQVNDMLRSAA